MYINTYMYDAILYHSISCYVMLNTADIATTLQQTDGICEQLT